MEDVWLLLFLLELDDYFNSDIYVFNDIVWVVLSVEM